MKTSDIVYFSLLGICNFILIREIVAHGLGNALLQGFSNLRIRIAVLMGLTITVVGGIFHRVSDFNPDINNDKTWIIVFVLPFLIAWVEQKIFKHRWTKQFGTIVEASMAKTSSRFNDYHTARMEYEKYLEGHKDLLVNYGGPTPTARKEAEQSQELARIEKLFQKSIEGAKQKKDYFDEAIAYQQLGQLYFYQGRLNESKSVLQKSLDIFSGLVSLDKSHKSAQSDIHYFLGLTLMDLNDFAGAEKELKISIAIDKANGNTYNLEYGKFAVERLAKRRKESKK